MSNVIRGPHPLLVLMQAMVDGLPKLPPTVTSVTIENRTYTMTELGTKMGEYLDPYLAVEKARLQQEAALEARRPIEDEAHEFVMGGVFALKAALGKTSANLELVGIKPDKVPTPLTVEQKTARGAKSAATRKERHTMGPRQKAKITGETPSSDPKTGR